MQPIACCMFGRRLFSSVQYISNDNRVVLLDFHDLLKNSVPLKAIEIAYGYDGLGILAVKNVPEVKELRAKLLPLARKFANLPENVREKYVLKDSMYSFGWSHGKEMMSKGKPDFSKGSFYNNPIYDVPFQDQELIKKYPTMCHPNIWPKNDVPEMEQAFKQLGSLVVNVGQIVARAADLYVQHMSGHVFNTLQRIVAMSRCHKGRLLHYYTVHSDQSNIFDSWCGMHNDHGTITGLVPAMFFDENNLVGTEISNPDTTSGLYVQTRKGCLVQIKIPSDYLAFQIGETAQIHTGGLLVATPHAVRAATSSVSRSTLAVFMEPEMFEEMKPLVGTESNAMNASSCLPPGIPSLRSRWNPHTDNFNSFGENSYKAYTLLLYSILYRTIHIPSEERFVFHFLCSFFFFSFLFSLFSFLSLSHPLSDPCQFALPLPIGLSGPCVLCFILLFLFLCSCLLWPDFHRTSRTKMRCIWTLLGTY